MTRARYIGSTKIDKNYLEMEFEYRGKTYFVTRALSWTACSSDYTINGANSERNQHKRAQKLIDNELDNPKEIKIEPYNNSAENAFKAFLDYVDGNENAFDNL